MEIINVIGSSMGLALLSGVNLYATILTIGLGLRLDLVSIPSHLSSLSILASSNIIIAASIGYILEFFADKIPLIDTLWDSIHAFIRPIGSAIIGIQAFGHVDPSLELTILLLCGGVGLSSHTTKASIRLAANHSPEPFSNGLLSLLEDITVFWGTIIAIKYPVIILLICILFLIFFIYLIPKIFRLIKALFIKTIETFQYVFASK